jgi:tetratricopeptide (TPR) repeat protein
VRSFILAFSIILILGLSYFLFWPKITEPIPIAVISFENQTGDRKYDMWSKIIPNLLITNLEQSNRFQVIPWERLHDLLKQLGKDSVEYIDSELGFKLCQLDGVPNMMVGTIVKMGDMFVTDLKILDVETKHILHAAQTKGISANSIMDSQIDELNRKVAIEFGGLSEEKYRQSHRAIVDVTTNSHEAYKYYILGKENFDKYHFREAVEYFTKAVKIDSMIAMAHIYLAKLGGYKGRNEHLRLVDRLRSKVSSKERSLLDFWYDMLSMRNISQSLEALKIATSIYPKEKLFYKALGEYYFSIDFDSALYFYKKALQLNPTDDWVLNELGYLYLDKKEYEKALEYFQRYIDTSPNQPNVYDSMGDVYFFMNYFEKAIELYEKALKIKPGYAYPNEKIASILIIRGEYQKARDQLYQYSELLSNHVFRWRFHRFLACSYLAEGDFQNTIKEMEKIDNLTKQESDTVRYIWNQFDISEILYENGKLKEAEERLAAGKKLMESIDMSDEWKYRLWGIYLWHSTRWSIKTGKIDLAKKYAEEYKNKFENSTNPIKFSLSAIIAFANENYQKAISDLQQSNLDSPPFIKTIEDMSFNKYLLALTHLKKSEKKKAIEKFNSVIDYNYLVTPSSEIFRHKAKLQLAKLGQNEY